jgi:hypothetical protein
MVEIKHPGRTITARLDKDNDVWNCCVSYDSGNSNAAQIRGGHRAVKLWLYERCY